MEIPKAQVERFKKIVAKDYGINISDNDAHLLGTSLLKLTRLASTTLARKTIRKNGVVGESPE
jgi:hypothetical protein